MKDLRLVRKLGSLLMLAASIFGVSAAVPASVIPAAQASACEWQGGYWNHVYQSNSSGYLVYLYSYWVPRVLMC